MAGSVTLSPEPTLPALNDQQRAAVHADDQHLAIIAGPGTGKTLTLAARLAFWLQNGVAAQDICAITFTQKAAAELQERVTRFVGTEYTLPFIGTFHALAYHTLRSIYPERRLLSLREQANLLGQVIKSIPSVAGSKRRPQSAGSTNQKLSLKTAQLWLSRAKNRAINPEELPATVQSLFSAYQTVLQEKQVFDFDELLVAWEKALQQGLARPFSYVLIDEFQDTNQLQQWLSGLSRFTLPQDNTQVLAQLAEHLCYQETGVGGDRVTLLTMHAAKGLEFSHVFVLACEDGSIPHAKADSVAEEERLLYVALTRAKNRVLLSFARKRNSTPVKRSPFIDKIHKGIIKHDEALPAVLRKRAHYQAKKNQMSLF